MPPAASPPTAPAAAPAPEDWHALAAKDVLARLETTPEGLAEAEAAARLARHGPNALPVRPPPSLAAILLHQFLSPLIYVLIVAGIVSVAVGEWSDAGFIFAVIALNAALGAAQEWKAERSAAALQTLLQTTVRVRRGGRTFTVAAEALVPGDLVLLESGGRVPADLRLVEARGLQADESLLTGESTAVDKDCAPLDPATPLAERRNLAFAGATVESGRALGVVVATGGRTEVGRIARAVATTAAGKPPLVTRMERFARQVSYLVLGLTLALGTVAALEGIPWLEVFFMVVALAVSAIPEGLPVAMTVALSIATSRMARRKVIVRKLTAVEGLGSCTCIASDKTGTLTVNRQAVRRLWLPGGARFDLAGDGALRDPAGAGPPQAELQRLEALARAALHCSEGLLVRDGDGWRAEGDAMDAALHGFGLALELDREALRRTGEHLGEIPYEPARRFSARAWQEDGAPRLAVKGAAERVLDFCTDMAGPGGEVPLARAAVETAALELAADGYRVLAVAAGPAPAGVPALAEGDLGGLTLLGLVGFIDPLRPDAAAAVATARRAGVRVLMVTGDHPATALAVARELGIATATEDVATGAELEAADAAAFAARVATAAVFARVAPLQKLRIVEALADQGHFVAVTGDGVNDAPALRRAHIGVAMGSGTDIARDTAEIIVQDDSIASVVAGIEEGRFAYANIRKVVYLLISTGAAELVLFALALAAGLPLPLSAVQLLWLNLVTNGIQDVALAFEGGEPGAMARPPRSPREGIFNPLMVREVLLSGAVMGGIAGGAWLYLHAAGVGEAAARNLLLLLMVLLENVHVFNCRSETRSAFAVPLRSNRLLIAGVVVAQGIHILALQLPPLQGILGTAPVTFGQWLELLGLAALLLAAMEVFKAVQGRHARGGAGGGGKIFPAGL